MIITTTSNVEGAHIEEYLQLVSANVVIGTNIFSDWFASVTDIFGGKSRTYQRKLDDLYAEALKRVEERAEKLGADAVVGLKRDYGEVSGKDKRMLMVSAVGNAVKLRKQSNPYYYEKDFYSRSRPYALCYGVSAGVPFGYFERSG